jgi:IS30 family transposase
MGTRYLQLSLDDRCHITSLQAEGRSIRQIAADLDRAPSTIAREIKRNAGRKLGYRPAYADEQTRARRWKGSKLERNGCLRQTVLDRLKQGWSPEQIAGRLARERANPSVSHETIYRFIYAQIARTKDYSWRNYLPCQEQTRMAR